MKTTLRLLMVFSMLAGAVIPAQAKGAGGQPGAFLAWGAGARSMGMGKAFSAVADDASATYWNPAGMVQLERKEVQAMHVDLFQDTKYDFFSYVHPTSRGGVLGFNMTRLVSDGFEKLKTTIDPTSAELVRMEKIGTYSDVHQAYGLSYGRQFTENMAIGITGKSVSHRMDTFEQGFTALDAGFFARNIFPNHRMAFVAQNVVSQVKGDTDDALPLSLKVGNAYSLLRNRITIAADVTRNSYAGLGLNFGAEYWAMSWASLRIGIESSAGGVSETSAGLGIRRGSYSLDMSVSLHQLGASQRFSASWRFGRSIKSSQRDEAKSLIEMGHELFRQGDYLRAIQKFGAALDVDPSNKEIQAMVAKLQDIVADLPKAPQGEVGRLVAVGVKSYMEADMNGAYDAFRAAFDTEPENAQLMNLTNRIAKLANKHLVETPSGPAAAARWTLVDQKLHDALQAIYEGRYDVAIQKCDEVLRIEPNNVTAIGRMGASFFLMGEKDKAVALWKRALDLDPSHKPAIEYLQQLGEYGR